MLECEAAAGGGIVPCRIDYYGSVQSVEMMRGGWEMCVPLLGVCHIGGEGGGGNLGVVPH